MDIGSGNSYPANALSNFSPHPFVLDDVQISSMEGFLQSLKFENPEVQREVCKLVGRAAKTRGRKKNWQQKQILWWKGKPYSRSSAEYYSLLQRSYGAMLEQSSSFRKALRASGKAVFNHSIGRSKETETVLTAREFCSLLTQMRKLENDYHKLLEK